MGFLGISGKNWKNVGKWALRAAPIVAAPFTGGASLLAIGAGAGAASGALGGGGWKGAALGGALGAIPGGGAGGAAAGGAAKAGLKQGLVQGAKKLGTQAAIDVGSKAGGKYLGGPTGQAIAGGLGSALSGGGFKTSLQSAGKNVVQNAPQTALNTGLNLASRGGGGGNGNVYQNSLGTGGGGGNKMVSPYSSLLPQNSGGGGDDEPSGWGKWGPLAGQVGGAVVGGIMSNKAQKSAEKRSPEEQLALSGAQGAAGTLGQGGRSLFKESRPYISQPASYYQTLLHGNRAAMTQAVAPAMAQVTGAYRGAQRNLNQQGVRGAARDVASGDLARDQASKIAALTTGVQPAAAGALAGLGTDLLQQVNPMLSNSGNIYGNLLTGGLANRTQAAKRGQEAGAAWGGLVRDIGEAIPAGKKKAGSAKTPPAGTTQTTRTPGAPAARGAPVALPQIPNLGQVQPGMLPQNPTNFPPGWNSGAWG